MCVAGVAYNCNLPPLPPLINYPPKPQRPPQQQDSPNPQAVIYPPQLYLRFPSIMFFNMDIYFYTYEGPQKISSSEPIWLRWKYFPVNTACPQIQSTTTNTYISTELRQIKYYQPCYYDRIGTQDAGLGPLSVLQLAFINQRWIVAVHEVDFPPLGPYPTEEDLKNAYNNRKERLTYFYDSNFSGLGIVYGGMDLTRRVLVSLYGSHAEILYDYSFSLIYTVQPTSNIAYAMFIRSVGS